MSMKKSYIKRVLTAALALSIIAGTGVASVGASALSVGKISDFTPVIAEKYGSFKNWIVEQINANFDTEQAKEIIAKISEKALAMIPDEVKQQFAEVVKLLSDEELCKEMIRQLISEFADETYKIADQTVQYLIQYAAEEYQNLPEEVRAEIEAEVQQLSEALGQIKEFVNAIKARAEKYTVDQYGFVTLEEGDFLFNMRINAKLGVEATAINYRGSETTVTVPAEADGFPVTSAELFSSTKVKSVKLPASITKIDGLVTFGLPNAKFVYVDAKNPNFKSVKGIVYDKEGTKLVAVPKAREFSPAEGVTSIGALAYFGNVAKSVVLPSTVTSIDKMAFYGATGLEEINIPDGVATIESSTFAACYALKKITVPSTVTWIEEDAFSGVPTDAVFVCESYNDYAVYFAEKNGYQVSAPQFTEFNSPSLVLLGASAKFSINVKYGEGGYTYSYLVRKVGDEKWTKLKMNTTDNTCVFTPAYDGYYEVCMKVKNASGAIEKCYSTMKVAQLKNNRSNIVKSVTPEGTTVTVNCRAIDPKSEYAVYYKEASASKWITAQKYDKNKVVDIALSKPGDYQICVKAKSSLGFISKVYFDVTADEPIEEEVTELR